MSILLYGAAHLEQAWEEARRPRRIYSDLPVVRRLRRIPLWQCRRCRREWHWPKRPEECGFCAFSSSPSP